MLNFAEIVLKKDATIIQALVAIDRGSCKTAFVADSDGKLAAAVTDGDIRRALIRGAELSAPIEGVANSSPISVNQDYRCARVRELMQANLMNAVPVVDGRGRIIDVLRLNDLVVEANQTPVVIMAGGLGRRLGALVEDIPKPMLKVAGEPILQHIIGNLTRFGFANIFLSINYKSNVIENYFGDGSNFGCNIQYIRESKRLGTGGSIRLCEGLIRTDFLVINGDILTKANLMKMLRFHVDNRFDMTVGTVNHTVNVDYGVLEVEGDTIRALKEKPVLNYKINGGVYCLSPEMISKIPKDEYFEITQLLTGPVKAGSYEINDYWIDIGRISQYESAERDFVNVFGA